MESTRELRLTLGSASSRFLDLAERFRAATDPEEVSRLGDQVGRTIFGD
jgi:hypothetical protein